MNRRLKSTIAASLLSAWVTLPSCAPKMDSDTYLQQEASDLQRRTLPPDSHLVSQHSLLHQGSGASANWDFDSNYSPDAYIHWVSSKLQPGFQVREDTGSRLRFSKYAHGDAETLSMDLVASSGKLHVAVKLEIYPD